MISTSAAAARRVCGAAVLAAVLGPSLVTHAAQARSTPPARDPAPRAALGFHEAELARAEARLESTRGRIEAIAPLLQAAALIDSLPPGRLEPVVRRVVEAPDTDPLVAAHAGLLLARLEDGRGDAARAAERRRGLGLLEQFWVVGPFGEGRASLDQVFPPEAEAAPPDPARRYQGKVREVGWRDARAAVRQGALLLDATVSPDSQAVAYALVFVKAARPGAAALRLGSPGPVKVWWNGALVHRNDVVRAAALDQDAVGVRVERGWNRLLVKTAISDGAWRLYARLTDPNGRPFPVSQATALPAASEPGATRSAAGGTTPRVDPRVPAVRALEPLLRRRASSARGPLAATPWLDLGRFLAHVQPGEREARAELSAIKAAVSARSSLEGLLLLAEVARDDDERRRALEQALAKAAGATERAYLLAKLGDVARAQRREAVALERWRDALRADPRCWPAAVALADEEQTAGLPSAALARLDALDPAARRLLAVRRQRAKLLHLLDRQDQALGELIELHETRATDIEVMHELAMMARARGDARRAIELLRRAAALRPDVPAFESELARMLEGQGDVAGALAVLGAAVARIPDEPALRAALGKLQHRLGRTGEALENLRVALALRPQNPELRRYLESLDAAASGARSSGVDDLARRFAADVPALLGWSQAASPTAASPPRGGSAARADVGPDPAVVVLDRRVVRVHPNGLAQTFAQRVLELKTDRGAEDYKEFFVRYTPGAEEVEIRHARIFRRGPGGDVQTLEVSERDDQDLSEPWYGLYYDYRAEVVRFEGLRAGDVVEVQYLIDDVSHRNEMAGYFGDLQFIAETIPRRRWDYTLLVPATRTFYTNTPRVAGLETEVSEQGGERRHHFAARDVPKIAVEPAMPGYAEVAPYLHVSTYASWRDVGAWYWRMVEEQMISDETVRAAAWGAVTRKMTDAEKVRAIHALVVGGTRYVGLEFGIHGYKPYKVSQVLARKFGDCKDKATLMVALLREVGVEAEVVLLRTRRGGKIEPQPASLAAFDHAIAYVPSLDLYLDGTAEFAGLAELPSQDQGVMVLRVGARGAVLTETPVLPSRESRAERRWQVSLHAEGDARVEEELTLAGQAAPEWRAHYQTPGERVERYAKVWSGRHPGAKLLSLEMPGIEDRNQPVRVRAVATVPRLGRASGAGTLELPITVREADFGRTYARLSTRSHELVIAYPWQHAEELVFDLPEGWKAERLPAGFEVEAPFGRFRLEVTREGDRRVRVRSALDMTRHRIASEEYGRFRAFLGSIDAALSNRIVIEKGAP